MPKPHLSERGCSDMQHDLTTTMNMTKVGTFITQMKESHALYWQCNVASNISYTFSTYEHKLEIDPALQDFIDNDCNFEITHADGSFNTHNLFCATYCRVHMPQHSWRVLYIHSIMGTGTNYFPMITSQIPKLKALLTPYEIMHVEHGNHEPEEVEQVRQKGSHNCVSNAAEPEQCRAAWIPAFEGSH